MPIRAVVLERTQSIVVLAPIYCHLIEWAERIEELLPLDRLGIFITQTDANSRKIKMQATGFQSINLLQALKAAENED